MLSAQANGITLLVISALVAFEAISRLIRPVPATGGIASLIVVGLMLHAAWGLLRETGHILLEAAPEGYAPG